MALQILLIDDDSIITFIHTRIIQSQFPYTPIVTFDNGHKALEHIKRNLSCSFLIFLDLNMPDVDGWDFLEAMSQENGALQVQVHLLTSSIDPADKIKAKNNKLVCSYLLKPLKADDLKSLQHP